MLGKFGHDSNSTISNEYVQSANYLSHFMEKAEYLHDILRDKVFKPRYCLEDIKYLNLILEGKAFTKIAILQKCFCDIPIYRLLNRFNVTLKEESKHEIMDYYRDDKEKAMEKILEIENKNTHVNCYGLYGISLSKKWGEEHHLQPVHYVNQASDDVKYFSDCFYKLWNSDYVDESVGDYIFLQLAFMKPLRGDMERTVQLEMEDEQKIIIEKNFCNECEWRYVPEKNDLSHYDLYQVIANTFILSEKGVNIVGFINEQIARKKYQSLWLRYDYEDIQYIFVPNHQERVNLIDFIMSIPTECFDDEEGAVAQKLLLISKIYVLSQIEEG